MALPASHPEIMARFVKESSLKKSTLFPDVDHTLRILFACELALLRDTLLSHFFVFDMQSCVCANTVREPCRSQNGSSRPPADFCSVWPDKSHQRYNGVQIDVGVRTETLRARGEPVMLQLPLVPCYALTIHKTQALSIKHVVCGCLEGVFAFGHLAPNTDFLFLLIWNPGPQVFSMRSLSQIGKWTKLQYFRTSGKSTCL